MLKALFTDEADKNRPYLFFVNDAEIKGKNKTIFNFPVWLRISAVLEPVPSHTEISCIISYYNQNSTNIKG